MISETSCLAPRLMVVSLLTTDQKQSKSIFEYALNLNRKHSQKSILSRIYTIDITKILIKTSKLKIDFIYNLYCLLSIFQKLDCFIRHQN